MLSSMQMLGLLLIVLCGLNVNGGSVTKEAAIVKQVNTYRTEGVYSSNVLNSAFPLVLSFTTNIDPTKFSEYSFSLYLNTSQTVVTSDKFTTNNTGSTVFVTITRPTEDYLDVITLLISRNGANLESATVEYYPTLSLIKNVRTVRVTQGGSSSMFCDVRGAKNPSIAWTRAVGVSGNSTESITKSDRYNITSTRLGSDTLVINTVSDTDAGIYFCTVTSGEDKNTALFELRVKDRLAALWPFIGIVIEVIILAIAILLYEKRRKHQAREKESEQQKNNVSGGGQTYKAEGHDEHDAETRQRAVKA